MSALGERLYGVYVLLVAAILMPVGTLLIILAPGLALRRRLARRLAQLLLLLAGAKPSVRGLEHIPAEACVVVANHASYLDGVLLKAVLPPRFSFVIKEEARSIPLGGFMLRRLGSEFVNRHDGHAGARDAKRIFRAAERGQALGFFPEGTFVREAGLRPFRLGAFSTACRGQLPVVPVAISGSRRMLPSGAWLPRPSRLVIVVLPAHRPAGTDRHAAQALMASVRDAMKPEINEPDLGRQGAPGGATGQSAAG